MKTITIKRAAAFLTIVSIIAASNIALAQRRSNHYKNGEVRMEKKRETGKNSAQRKGSAGHWSSKSAKHYGPSGHLNKNFYPKHKHRNSKHWDKHWESYHWNVTSWADYYNGYHPYSYKFHKYYYVHPQYGHVIRKFRHRPEYFVHKNLKYYNYNGHLFRYFRGVGYVLTKIPYNMAFQKLPADYERVYINGYLYFRVGNLFFEMNPNGYSLVHYPEKYLAFETRF